MKMAPAAAVQAPRSPWNGELWYCSRQTPKVLVLGGVSGEVTKMPIQKTPAINGSLRGRWWQAPFPVQKTGEVIRSSFGT